MKQHFFLLRRLIAILISCTFFGHVQSKSPRLTVVIVIDQFAHHYLEKIKPHISGGIHTMLTKGIIYNNAYMPHFNPSTAAGHTTMSTGAFPKTHGIIGNGWLDEEGRKVKHEKMHAGPKFAVFSPTGLYPHGHAPHHIMVDNFSDQFMLADKPNQRRQVFSFAHKPRAAIGMGGKLGKTIWFDYKGRQFTSSKAYFNTLPEWVKTFNSKYLTEKIPQAIIWKLFHKDPLAYNFYDVQNYNFADHPFSLIDTPFKNINNEDNGTYSELYIKTPSANQHILDLAQTCIEKHLSKNKNDKFLLWISMGPLDPVGHYYGPWSRETLDMIYHLDWQIDQFMKFLEKKVDPKEILYVLTADHGVMPIPELMQKRGYHNAYRIISYELTKKINEHIKKKHGVENVMQRFLNSTYYLNRKVFDGLSKEKQKKITVSVKAFLEAQPGIMKVWTDDEAANLTPEPYSIDFFFKNQIYKGRSGEFIIKYTPYSVITRHEKGTSHRSPYEYDTHVPLSIYQKGVRQNKSIDQKVYMTQLANTLAKICETAKPSASQADPLPGI